MVLSSGDTLPPDQRVPPLAGWRTTPTPVPDWGGKFFGKCAVGCYSKGTVHITPQGIKGLSVGCVERDATCTVPACEEGAGPGSRDGKRRWEATGCVCELELSGGATLPLWCVLRGRLSGLGSGTLTVWEAWASVAAFHIAM